MTMTTQNETLKDHEQVLDSIDVDLGYDPTDGINTHINADRTLYAIGNLDAEIAREQEFKKEAEAFYQKRIQQKEQARSYLTQKLEDYLYHLETNGHDAKASTPNGTAFIQRKKSPVWDSEDKVLEWAKKNAPDTVMVVEKPDKAKLKKVIEEKGDEKSAPLSYETKESISIRKPSKKQSEPKSAEAEAEAVPSDEIPIF